MPGYKSFQLVFPPSFDATGKNSSCPLASRLEKMASKELGSFPQ